MREKSMKILWVNPVFSEYRVPVYEHLDELCDGGLTVMYSKRRVPNSVSEKIEKVLGHRALGLKGEKIVFLGGDRSGFGNRGIQIPYQPRLLKTVLKQKWHNQISVEALFI